MSIDPLALFELWYGEARATELNDSNAMALATVNADGQPTSRIPGIRFDDDASTVRSGAGVREPAHPFHVCWTVDAGAHAGVFVGLAHVSYEQSYGTPSLVHVLLTWLVGPGHDHTS